MLDNNPNSMIRTQGTKTEKGDKPPRVPPFNLRALIAFVFGGLIFNAVSASAASPNILGSAQYPATPTSGAPVWITTYASDQTAVAAVNLVYDAGAGQVTVPMFDDGSHEDGAAGDGMYGGQIPAFPLGTAVRHSISATNNAGQTATDPVANLTSIGYLYSYTVSPPSQGLPVLNALPGGTFTMGDAFNTVDPNHPNDQLPLHTVALSPFSIGRFDVTNEQYCGYLNAGLTQGLIQVTNGIVYGAGTSDAYCETRQGQLAIYGASNPPLTTPYSGISWNGHRFSVLAGQQNMPMVGVYWDGAVAYANWLGVSEGFQPVYTYDLGTATWSINYSAQGYRLPTEAEWEYAANGGRTSPYYMYAWGNDPNTGGSYANTLGSGSPWAQSNVLNVVGQIYPWSTPVGFYNGQLHQRSAFGWTSSLATYQTCNAENGFGLYDMGGNIWQWTNDWYLNTYYSLSPISNPTGPATGSYHTLRGGSWAQQAADATVSARDPSVNREPLHNTTYASIGFRLVLTATSPIQPGNTLATAASNLNSGGGIAADPSGNIYYSETGANTISRLATSGQTSVFLANDGGDTGLIIDARGNVVAGQATGKIVAINSQGITSVLASGYNHLPFNAPNSLWIDPQGGIYFTDPVATASQPQAVYYVSPDRTTVAPVITNLSQPAGIAGNSSGTQLYVGDLATGKTYAYSISSGQVSNPTQFASVAAAAIAIDTFGNVYLATSSGVQVYSAASTLLSTLAVPAAPVGIAFGGNEKRTLFILTQNAIYSIATTTQGETINGTPTIAGAAREITTPLSTEGNWVSANVADDGSMANVQLSYTSGGTGLPVTEFTETMTSVSSTKKAWDGTGADNPWIVTQPTGTIGMMQVAGANFGPGGTSGVRFAAGTSNPADTMITTVNGINTAGSSATLQFYVECNNSSASEGWAFQVNGGNGWETVASESNLKHSWQVYKVVLSGAQLSSNMLMRFQFQGNGSTDSVDLDDITVQSTFGTTTVVSMYDDGQHHDGAAGDGVWGAQIPAFPTGTIVVYHVIATDNTGQISVDPAGAPYYYAYNVGQAATTVQFNEVMANATSFLPTPDYPTKNLGLLTSSNVGPNTAGGVADGYLLVPAMAGSKVYLVDTQGRVINQWTSSYTSTGRSVFVQPDGSLIRSNSLSGSQNPIIGENVGGVIEKFDWNGNRVGYFTYAGYNTQAGVSNLGYAQHHNILVMPNGNILMTTVQSYTPAQALAAGFNPVNLFGGTNVLVDGVVEVKPDWAHNTYTEVWRWSYWNHLVQTYNPGGQSFFTNSNGQTVYVGNYSPTINNPYKLNANFNGSNTPVLDRLYAHQNGLDYNTDLDEIVLSARVTNEIYVIDHSTTTDEAATGSGGRRGHGGDFLYRWGNPAMYGAPGNQTLFMQHNARWIPAGYPGAGDITVMNNGNNRTGATNLYTIISEITPPVNPDGSYSLMANGAYGPLSETWTYTDTPPSAFYNSDGGGAQRLPNGDTMISFDTQGLAFEVNAAGQINWQFQNADGGSKGVGAYSDTILFQGDGLTPDYNLPGGYTTTVYNCPWYPVDYFTFTNQRLSGSGTIEKYRNWFELYNSSSSAVDLSGLYLSNDPAKPTLYQIPAGTSIPAQGCLLFYADNDIASSVTTPIAAGSDGVALPAATISVKTTTGFPSSGTILVTTSAGVQTVTYTGITATSFTACQGGTGTMSSGGLVSAPNTAAGRHTNFTLSSSGGSIYLYDVDGVTQAASVSYPASAADVSYGRNPDGTGNWATLSLPSPGWQNVPAAPTSIALSTTNIADNQPIGTALAFFSATDVNPFDTCSYSIVSGPGSTDNTSFSISGATLQNAVVFNANSKNSYGIRVRATNANGLFLEQAFTILVAHVNQPPTVRNTGLVGVALPSQGAWVNSAVSDQQGLSSVALVYTPSISVVTTPLTESFGSTPVNAWTGGADNSWTVNTRGTPFKLTTAASYMASGTTCGLQYNCSKTNTSTITTAPINLAGLSATVSFWVQTVAQSSSDGWMLQLGSGGIYATCLSESGTSHGFQHYTYQLTGSQLVSGLSLQFQFTGGGTGDSGIINLDQIIVTLTSSSPSVTVPMYDDGAHNDGAAGDGVFGAQIPAFPSGTQVIYSIAAMNVVGLVNSPNGQYCYTVATPITNWRQTWFGTTANSGIAADGADPYGKGVQNIMAYAFLGPVQDPAKVQVSQLPQGQISGGFLTYSFTEPTGITGITYGAEWSATLMSGSWQPITDSGNGTMHIFSMPVGSYPRLFLRLTLREQ